MRLLHAFTLLALCSCGANNSTNPDTTITPAIRSEGVSTAKTDPFYSIAVNAEPPCLPENDNQIIYVRPEQSLKACTSGEWVVITTRGATGEKGVDGTTGPVGERGPKGDPGRIPSPTEWIDLTTNISWLVGADQSSGQMATASVCGGSYRMGTQAEVKIAILNGLGVFVAQHSSLTYVWTSDIHTTSQRFAIGFDSIQQFPANGVVVCREN